MVGVLIVTHSPLAMGLLDSSKMIMGEDIPNCHAYVLELGQDLVEFEAKFERLVDSLDTGDGVLVMVDLFAGTPANTAMRVLKNHKFQCISGVNLGMVIEALSSRMHLTLEEVKEAALAAGKNSIVDITSIVFNKGG